MRSVKTLFQRHWAIFDNLHHPERQLLKPIGMRLYAKPTSCMHFSITCISEHFRVEECALLRLEFVRNCITELNSPFVWNSDTVHHESGKLGQDEGPCLAL